jgi:LuxR family maltose regulon positive regulatory protein
MATRYRLPELARPRLERQAKLLLADHVVLIRAPSGYGKSVLLRQWCEEAQRRGQPAALISLADRVTSASELHAMLRHAADRAGHAQAADVFDRWPRDRVPAAEPAAGTPLLVMIDDVHPHLSPSVLLALQELLEGNVPHVQWALATRGCPSLAVGRLFAQGMRELGPDDLRFSAAETLELFESCGLTSAAKGLISHQIERSEGWPSGVRMLVAASFDHMDDAAGAHRPLDITERLHSFFFENVLGRERDELTTFLVQMSILSVLDADACNAIAQRSDSSMLLLEAEQRGLFINRAHSTSLQFRHHPMFADALREQLRRHFAPWERALHRRAAEHFWSAKQYKRSIEHLFEAADLEAAAARLEDWCAREYESCGHDAHELAVRLPRDLIAPYPHLMLTLVEVLAFRWEFDHALSRLDECRQRLDALARSSTLSADSLQELEHRFMHCQMWCALFQNDTSRAVALGQHLVEHWRAASPLARASVFMIVMQAESDAFTFTNIEVTAERARRLLELSSHRLPQVPLVCALARARYLAGRQNESIAPLRELLRTASSDEHSIGSIGCGLLAIALAQICYERNELADAEELLNRYLPSNPGFSFLEEWITGRLVLARLRMARGDVSGSLESLALDAAWAPDGGLVRLRQVFGAEQIAILIHSGRPEDARAVGRRLGLSRTVGDVIPAGNDANSLLESRALAAVRLAVLDKRYTDALKVCAHWRAFASERTAIRSLIRWEIITASALAEQGKIQAAQRHLRNAISVAAPGNYLRSIIDGGRQIGTLLLDNPSLGAGLSDDRDSFCNVLVNAFERDLGRSAAELSMRRMDIAPPNLLASLSAREREMLQFIASGCTNREVAERIAVTEGTVKWYLHHLYAKLGVNRRTMAVKRARELGIA